MKLLPDVTFELPEWEDRHFQVIRAAEEKIRAIGGKAGKGSDEFKNACRRLLEFALSGRASDIGSAIKSALDVRAFTYLLSSSYDFSSKVEVSRSLLDQLLGVRAPVSRLTLMQLIRAFFVQFDEVADEQGLADWSAFIQSQLNEVVTGTGSSELKQYAKYSEVLFGPYGPSRVVKYAKNEGVDFDGLLKRFGLTGFSNGRYLTLCRYQYYLETLKSLPVGEKNDVLSEICKSDVVNSPYTPKKQLGHVILEILIDRSEGQAISQSWQSTILTIAGDPRVPKSSAKYQQWWAILGEKRIALMRGWLSRFDLKLFLKILEQSAKDGSNSDMERMFKPRKKFMEGLLNQGVVAETRLFLTSKAEYYLCKNYEKKDLPSYANVSGSQASVIYLRLTNDIHMVEGTHSFSIRLMDKLPARSHLTDYARSNYQSRSIGVGLGECYRGEFGRDDGLMETAHHSGLTWQNKVISYLKNKGVNVEVGKLIRQDELRMYKSKFGVN